MSKPKEQLEIANGILEEYRRASDVGDIDRANTKNREYASEYEDEFICGCGEDNHTVLLTIDNKCMCENCIQKLLADLRGE